MTRNAVIGFYFSVCYFCRKNRMCRHASEVSDIGYPNFPSWETPDECDTPDIRKRNEHLVDFAKYTYVGYYEEGGEDYRERFFNNNISIMTNFWKDFWIK